MPLERIGVSLPLFRRSTDARGDHGVGRSLNHSHGVYDAGHHSLRESDQYEDAFGEHDANWTPSTPHFGAVDYDGAEYGDSGAGGFTSLVGATASATGHVSSGVRSINRPRPSQISSSDMALRKLGGVGGVQRSGSARFRTRRLSSRSTLNSSLSNSPEDEECDKLSHRFDDEDEANADATICDNAPTADASRTDAPMPSEPEKSRTPPSSPPKQDETVVQNGSHSPRLRPKPPSSQGGASSPRILPTSPSLPSSSKFNDFKMRMEALTLSAAAQAQDVIKGESSPTSFVPPEPRRHTGSFALRSRSSLAQTLGSSTMNFGNGQGRAAARKSAAPRIAAQTSVKVTKDDADILSSPDTPRTTRQDLVEPSPHSSPLTGKSLAQLSDSSIASPLASVPAWQTATRLPSTKSEFAGQEVSARLEGISPRTRTIDLVMSPARPFATAKDPNAENVDRSLAPDGELLSPIARASPDANYFNLASRAESSSDSNHSDVSSPRLHSSSRSPSAFSSSDLNLSLEQQMRTLKARDSLSDLAAMSLNGVSVSLTPRSSGSMAPIAVPGGSARPSFGRSATSVVAGSSSVNVLRTPTTEEWSRYLIQQGVDPSQLVQGKDGVTVRSRTSTTRSVQQGVGMRRRTSDRDPSHITIPSSSSMSSDIVEKSPSHTDRFLIAEGLPTSRSADDMFEGMRSSVSVDDLASVDEELDDDDNDEEDSDEYDAERTVDQTQIIHTDDDDAESLQRTIMRTTRQKSSGSEELSDGMDDHMCALHEAISRPPSRLGTPVPSDGGHEKLSGSVEGLRAQGEVRRVRWPSRETAAALMGYPLPPFGQQRNIDDFFIIDDIGRGAYGLVKKARVRDTLTGEPTGPELAIKYIIKSRILADCWRRHKILGPIPVEIHVLDQLRRLPYHVPVEPLPWSAERLYGLPRAFQSSAVIPFSKDGEDNGGVVTVGHPALCTMVDFFEDHEFYYMVMPQFGTGQDLFDYVESQPHGLSTKHVRCIFGQLADGLQFLHQSNIVHRDVKDENVILDGRGHIQLIDFGSAAHVNTRNGGRLFDTFSGTLDYAAAEILRGEKYGGKEQDVWALGVVGYVLLCGDCPFWNGEEAMHGLQIDSRAFSVLSERCRPLRRDDVVAAMDTTATEETTTNVAQREAFDRFTGLPVEPVEGVPDDDEVGIEIARRQIDLRGEEDGGGRLDDAADLIMQCLQLNQAERPTMELVLQHRFLLGNVPGKSWSGLCGWQRHHG